MSKEPELLNIKKLFNDKGKYVIPIYQRNFAWKKAEIEQLIVDIADSYADSYEYKKDNDYYIGTLIVAERKSDSRDNYFEVIDGQQRLTALSILLSLVKNEYNEYKDKADISFYKQNLTFDSRKDSDKVLDYIYNNGDENIDKLDIGDNENASSIIDGYKICKTELDKIFKEKFKDIETNFFDYLFNKVKILRVSVLEDTDLNHYFEIMNSRGEQLEMHEILKARLLDKLDENDRNIFNLIWEACSNMEKYIQFGFKTDLRKKIFDDNLNTLINKDELYNISPQTSDNESNNKVSIIEILENAKDNENNSVDDNKDEQERFNSVINFPNFLLHVLKIQEENNEENKIHLDDKKLLYTFDEILKDKEKIKSFGYNLLKVKFLFDKYVIKRNLEVYKWSLKQLKNSNYYNSFGKDDEEDEEIDNNEKDKDINEKILMLLSMFHVSYPAPTHKNWLYEVLKYLYNEFDNKKEINGKDYKKKLKEFAKERYEGYLNRDSEILDKGVKVPHFIFNYLDYLLWEKWKEDKENFKTYLGENKDIEKKINNFKFTSSNSVEHYYPQNPFDGEYLDEEISNNFGNLCLISASQNSKLSNNSPKAKKEHYLKRDIDSVKQAIMMSYEDWKNKIIEHGDKMKELLNSQINITQ